MSKHGCSRGILAVDDMPKGANRFLTEFHEEGIVFVTGREFCSMTYGVLRAILMTEYRLGRKAVNLQIALADERIREAIMTAYNVAEPLVSIRKRAKRIVSDARGIKNDADDADQRLRECLEEFQKRIDFAMDAIPQDQIAQHLQILSSSS